MRPLLRGHTQAVTACWPLKTGHCRDGMAAPRPERPTSRGQCHPGAPVFRSSAAGGRRTDGRRRQPPRHSPGPSASCLAGEPGICEGGAGSAPGGARECTLLRHMYVHACHRPPHPRGDDGTFMIREKKHRERELPWASGQHEFTSRGTGHKSVRNLASKLLPFSTPPHSPRGALGLRQPPAPPRGDWRALTRRLSLSRSRQRGLRPPAQ